MSTSETSKAVAIWLRVSTEDQVRGESPETHERRARGYAESRGWNVVEVYRLDAVSGKTVKDHPEAKRMLADIKSGHISALIFSKLARLGRNTKELLEFAEYFREHNADLVSLGESIDTSTPAGRLFYTMIAAMAHWERDEIASRVAASVPIRAKMGKPLGGAAPYGYAWLEQKLVIDENEAPIRKEMYELFKEHRRKKTVARFLNERGYRTRNGSNFSDTTVDRLLRDSTAKGVRRTNYTVSDDTSKAWKLKPESEWIFHEVDPIVSVELWDEVNAILDGQRVAGKRQTRRVAHLFAGYTFCECGSKMYVPSNSPKYVAKCCRVKIGVKDLEDVFKAELTGFVFSPDELRTHREQGEAEVSKLTDEVERLEKEQRKIQVEVDSLIDLYRSGMLDKEGFGPRYQKQAIQLKQIEDRLPELLAKRDVLRIALISQEEVLGGSRELIANWDNLDHSAKRSVIETILSRITVFSDDSVEIELLYSPGTPPSSTPPTTLIDGNKATNAQGFIAAMSWKRAGKSALLAAREMVI
jgi:site-specific DNA recombinase